MKKILLVLVALCSLALGSCSSDSDNNNSEMSNRWNIDEVTQTLYDNDTEGIDVTVRLALTPSEDVILEPVITCSDDEIKEMVDLPLMVVIPAGQKSATFKVSANMLNSIKKSGTVTLGFKECEGITAGTPVTFNVVPVGGDVEELTAEQNVLIETWKAAGFDAKKYLGVHKVCSVVYFNDNDKDSYNGGNSAIEYNSFITFNISPNATADDIVFVMKSNALGLQSFLYKMYKMNTVEDEEYWLANVHNADLLKAVNYNADKETFNASLEIHFNLDGTIRFTDDEYTLPNGDTMTGVPFKFEYSAWERQQSLSSYIIDNGDAGKEEITMTDAIEQGITLNPNSVFPTSDISYDAWDGGETSLYVAPKASYDDSTIKFVFPWDFMNAYGYEKIAVTINIK